MNFLLLTVYVLSIGGVYSQTGTDAKNLRTQLFVTDAYDKKVFPSLDQSFIKEVHVSYNLFSINGLDEVTETLTTSGYLYIWWEDDYLTWTPSDYGGIEYYFWPQGDVWKPDITLKNSVLDYKELGASGLNVEVLSTGVVIWYPFQVFQSTCSVDITHFPFDVQNCKLTFQSWSYTTNDVLLVNDSIGVALDNYQESSLWEIISTSSAVDTASGDPIITFTLEMKRKPLYFVLSVVMPILLLSVLNVFVFILPCESGERAGYSITVFLAFAVFLTIIQTTLPANSETTSIFAVYIIIQTVQSTMITLVALLTIRLSSKNTEVPRFLIILYRIANFQFCKGTKRNARVEPDDDEAPTNNIDISVVNDIDTDQWNSPLEKDQADRKWKSEQAHDTDGAVETVSWSMAVRATDLLLFVLFLSIFVISTLACLLTTASAT